MNLPKVWEEVGSYQIFAPTGPGLEFPDGTVLETIAVIRHRDTGAVAICSIPPGRNGNLDSVKMVIQPDKITALIKLLSHAYPVGSEP